MNITQNDLKAGTRLLISQTGLPPKPATIQGVYVSGGNPVVILAFDDPSISKSGHCILVWYRDALHSHVIEPTETTWNATVVPVLKPVEPKHWTYGTRVVLGAEAGKIACVGSWFVVVKFDNGDDAVFVIKNDKLHYRQSKNSTAPAKVAPLCLEK